MRQRWRCGLLQLLSGFIPHNTVVQYNVFQHNISVIQYDVIPHNVTVIQYNTVVILHNVFLHNISVIQYNTVVILHNVILHNITVIQYSTVTPSTSRYYLLLLNMCFGKYLDCAFFNQSCQPIILLHFIKSYHKEVTVTGRK